MENYLAFSMPLLEGITLWLLITWADPKNRTHRWNGHLFVIIIATATDVINNFNTPYHFAILILLMFLTLKVLTERSWIEVISDVIFANIMLVAYQFVITILAVMIIANSRQHIVVLIAFMIANIVIVMLLMKVPAIDVLLERFYRQNRGIILIALINIAILCSFIIHIWDERNYIFWHNQQEVILLAVSFVLVNIMLMVITYKYAERKEQLQQSNEYARFLSEITEQLSRRDHEHKNHLAAIIAIASYNTSDPAGKIKNYCSQLLDEQRESKPIGLITDNVTVAAFIKYKMKIAEERQIKFDCYIEKPYPCYNIPDYDVIELLANLLNNAFEASEQLDEEKRNIYLFMDSENIKIMNYIGDSKTNTKPLKIGVPGYSTKGRGHGYGIANIQTICKRYGIKYQISINEDNYITELTLHGAETQSL